MAKTKDDGIRLKARVAAERFGVTTKTLRNWSKNKQVGFPEPIRVLGRNYYSLAALQAFAKRDPALGAQFNQSQGEAV